MSCVLLKSSPDDPRERPLCHLQRDSAHTVLVEAIPRWADASEYDDTPPNPYTSAEVCFRMGFIWKEHVDRPVPWSFSRDFKEECMGDVAVVRERVTCVVHSVVPYRPLKRKRAM